MKKLFVLIPTLLLISFYIFAQKPVKIERSKADLYPTWIEFSEKDAPAFRAGQILLIDLQDRSSVSSSTKLVTKEKDQIGYEHHRMQQVYNNIPVEHAVYIAHVKGGKLMSQNGKWVKDFPSSLPKRASLSETAAFAKATQYVGASIYKWQDANEEAFIKNESNNPKATFFPKADLVYYSGQLEVDGPTMKLAYKFDIYASEPLSRKIVYIDANDGTILGFNDLIHEANVIGTATTGYSGSQAITTDSYNGSYRLRETGRGNGIQTFNLKQGTSYNKAVDFTDADNNWNNVNTTKDQYATDAHWGAEKTYDFFFSNFSRNSIDNNGFALKSYVHYSRNYFNAFWDGSRMTYGDGSSTTNGSLPLTALDVCGHEITHGLTSKTSNLVYSGESGALNEAFSDIFGESIEKYAKGINDWKLGKDFNYIIRDMSNPNSYGDPDTYQGTNWYTGTGDNGGVHINSGVLNFWFYLLTTGGSGTNDKGYVYNVFGIGILKAQAIAYRTLTTKLISSSNYASARTGSISAATELYGAASNEVTQVINAWNAVGVGGGTSPAPAASMNPSLVAGLEEVSSTRVYPNPVINNMKLRFNDENGGTKQLELVDIKGRVVLRKTISLQKGLNEIDLQTSSVKPGNYFIRINNKKIVSVVKQ
jgi:Zn-dependent metalloprotease